MAPSVLAKAIDNCLKEGPLKKQLMNEEARSSLSVIRCSVVNTQRLGTHGWDLQRTPWAFSNAGKRQLVQLKCSEPEEDLNR